MTVAAEPIAPVSHIRFPQREPNANTQFFDGLHGSSDLAAAYAVARHAVAIAPAPHPAGHILVWVSPKGFSVTQLGSDPRSYCVAGRHTSCDHILLGDEFVSLRHVLLRSVPRDDGPAALRVLDLHTTAGFRIPGKDGERSILAEGPVAIGLGSHALVAFPTGGEPPPSELPEAHLVSSAPPAPSPSRGLASSHIPSAEGDGPYRSPGRPPRSMAVSRVTMFPRAVMVGEALSPSLSRLTGGRVAITLESAGRSATVTVSREDLERGVLIGRSEKCVSEELRRITAVGTSRVHVLLILEDRRIVAYDLASTQGTWDDAGRVRRKVVEGPGRLVLGTHGETVLLHWRGV